MGLKLMKDGGHVRKAWYGQYMDNGKWKVIRLTTPMHGTPPASLKDVGDDAFERSRSLAQAEFETFEKRRSVKGTAEDLQIAIVESKTGRQCEYVRLNELPMRWRTLSRSYTPTESRAAAADECFRLFAEHAKVTFLYEVTPAMAAEFFNKIRAEYSWSTVKDKMSTLKSAFERFLPTGMSNPFASVIKRNRELNAAKVHRRPLSEAELQSLFAEASKTPMLNALAVTAACTGMRIGDVCNLKWESVDLRTGFISVLTSKAGQWVTIPILDRLREVLESALAERTNSEYVFPDAAQMYADNKTGIIRRGKALFARALFRDKAASDADEETIDVDHKDKTAAEVLQCIRDAGYTKQKTERCINVYTLYASGLTYRQIERETGLSRGQIAEYLHGIEDITGDTIVKWAKACATSNHKLILKTRQDRAVGKRSASLYGWHSLRASFVVAAITHGIPVEVVRQVVGHSTTNMTLEYFNPTKTIIADTMRRKMQDSILAGGSAPMITDGTAKPRKRGKTNAAHDEVNVETGELMALAAKLAKLSPAKRKQIQSLLG